MFLLLQPSQLLLTGIVSFQENGHHLEMSLEVVDRQRQQEQTVHSYWLP